MKKILLCTIALLAISAGANAREVTDQEAAENAFIGWGYMQWGGVSSLSKIDGRGLFLDDSGELVKPGVHEVQIKGCKAGNCDEHTITCNVVAGHYYAASHSGCGDLGITKSAGRYFKMIEEKKAQEQIVADKIKYQEYKQALLTNQPAGTLKNMKLALESNQGGFKDDPDGLLAKVTQQLQPYLDAEIKQQAADAADKAKRVAAQAIEDARLAEVQAKKDAAQAKEDARLAEAQAKEDAKRRADKHQQLTSFRKSLSDGGETNCGPVVEVKGKLVKVAYAVANYGNEHWIRREEIYPSGYGCSFFNGHYQPPQ